ncbi:hypothetical protein LCGC14_0479270 [marine sediment metagenome]|uniref:Uncharacterized protein n=1 Tax=marine sediment metagenome TaxID=412755 RepID=A0A0F9UWP3_9ZZZZ
MSKGEVMEEFICSFIYEASRRALGRLPICWFGTYNALSLYLFHPWYSPFVALPKFHDGRLMLTESERKENSLDLINRGIPDLPPVERVN